MSVSGKAIGGVARAKALTSEQRTEIAKKAAAAKKELASLPQATHGSTDQPLVIGDIEIPCYVLDDETRVLSQRGLQTGVGMSSGGSSTGEQRVVRFLRSLSEKPNCDSELAVRIAETLARVQNPIKFRMAYGGGAIFGYEATVLADICDIVLSARSLGLLQKQQLHIADRCELLVRGFARVGIIALVDAATGFERDRERDALAKILEAFIDRELQPWLRTFPPDFYEQICRLRGIDYPPKSMRLPQYIGKLTNNIVYDRLAPGVKEALQKGVPRNQAGRPTAKYFQKLTRNTGYPKLREHLGSVIMLMKLSRDWDDFMMKLEEFHPKLDGQQSLDLYSGH
jgi:hypothetical protein